MQFKHLVTTKNRHGTAVRYYQPPGGSKIRLRAAWGTPAFLREYLAARNGAPAPVTKPHRATPGTIIAGSLRWLIARYYASPAFKQLKSGNACTRRHYLDAVCQSVHPETGRARGDLPFAGMKRANVVALRDESSDNPNSANARISALRVVFNWAIDSDLTTYNPAQRVQPLPVSTEGYHAWTDAERAQFEAFHPIGTMARLAYALILYTGVRRSDAVRLGRQNERGGALHFTEYKGNNSRALGRWRPKPKARVIPLAPELRAIIDATPSTQLVYLVNSRGAPFTDVVFSNTMRAWCDAAGLPHCTAHGIRKAGATRIAEQGGTAHQVRAFGGWTNLAQVERYTASVNDAKLTAEALTLLRRR
jgi:integrase